MHKWGGTRIVVFWGSNIAMTKLVSILTCLLLLCAGAGYAADFYVGTVAALTNAVNTAASNDTVFISNGTYQVNNLPVGAGVTVKSISGLPSTVILNGNDAGRVVDMAVSGWLIGCTVTNGELASGSGAGVNGGSCSNCIIKNNHTEGGGGGASGCTLYNCLLVGNVAPMGANANSCFLYNCTLTGGDAASGGGSANSTLANCISSGNSPDDNYGVVADSYSCGGGLTGTGSTNADPLFIGGGNYRLQNGSPCRNTGNNDAWVGLSSSLDLDGSNRIVHVVVDMGCYENQYVPPVPTNAINPHPANGAIGQPTNAIISWQDGGCAEGYNVYFGLTGNMTNCGSTQTTNYNPGALAKYSGYQWRIDATNITGVTTGPVWTFRTGPIVMSWSASSISGVVALSMGQISGRAE